MNKTLSVLITVMCFLLTNAQNLTQQWATPFAGTGENSDKFNALIRDASGNIYAAGYTWASGNGKDFLLVKFNSAGDTVWMRTHDGLGNGNDEINWLAFDNSGNIIVTGYTKGTNGKDFTTAKYNTNGDSIWLVNYDHAGHQDDVAVKVITDASDNVYVGGYGYNPAFNSDYIVIQYSSSGAQQWVYTFDGADHLDDILTDIAIDGGNNIVAVGRTRTLLNAYDYGVVKISSAGSQVWVKTLDQAGKSDRASGVFIDANNDVYVTGRSSNGSSDDFLTLKYASANGNPLWLKIFTGSSNQQAIGIAGNATEVVVTGIVYVGTQINIQTIVYAETNGLQLWSTPYVGPAGKDDVPNHVTIDANSNVIVTGYTNVSSTSTSNNEILIIKYDITGTQQWVKVIGGTSNTDDAGSMSLLDGSGNVYMVGAIVNNGTMKDGALIEYDGGGNQVMNKAYNGEGEFTDKGETMTMSGGSLYCTGYVYTYGNDRDICTIKYDAGGNIQWTKIFNGSGLNTDEPAAIVPDGSGNIYITAKSKNLIGDYDILVIKYNPNGDTIWTRIWDGGHLGNDEPTGMVSDASGNVYITGYTDTDSSLFLTNYNFITLKYDANGVLVWSRQFNGTANADDKANAIATDAGGNNVYITGKSWNGTDYDIQTIQYSAGGSQGWNTPYTSGIGDDNPVKIKVDNNGNVIVGAKSDRDPTTTTNIDFLTIQYNSTGSQQWAKFYNGPGNGDDDLNNMTVDTVGNVYVIGTVDGDSSALYNSDYAIVKYDNAGNQQWAMTFNGAANLTDAATDVVVDPNGNVYVSGESNQGTSLVKNNDCVTMIYSPGGTFLQHITFDGPSGLTDAGSAILYDNGSIYITGYGTYDTLQQKNFLTIKYNILTHIVDLKNDYSLAVYPNPVSANSTLQFKADFDLTNAKLQLHDVVGNKITDERLSAGAQFDLSHLALSGGIYFVRLRDDQHLFETKIVIE